MIRAMGLKKAFGAIQAVDGVSVEAGEGEVYGLLGPNGAGKTTTINLLIGALKPDAGEVTIAGASDPTDAKVRRAIGVCPQSLAIYDELTAEENLRFFGALYGLDGARLKERVQWALEFAGLTDRRRDRVAHYSGGMKRRLNLACALTHEPRVVFCDEPTVGVDPQSRNHIFECIEALRKDGCTVLYTTHYMEEAQRLCDWVAIMDKGRILAVDTVERLITGHGGDPMVKVEFEDPVEGLHDLPGDVHGRTLRVQTSEPMAIIEKVRASGAPVRTLSVDRPDLEAVFLQLTGRTLRDD